VLDRTYFYPTGGGQPNDQGTLATGGGERAEVVDVTKSGASVVHRLRGGSARRPGFSVGDDVDGAIDWERRFRHMRLHTAQHFLSGRIFTRAGLRTRRASFGGVRALLELDGPLADDVVAALAEDVRTVVAPPRPVAIRHLPRAEWDRHPLSERSGLVPLPPHVDPVRVVEIDGFDLCPCGGTHLRSTGEIGAVVIERAVPVADGGSRLVFTLAPVGRAAPPS
jgi:misacylated tRNA(Ala) deacylase